MWKVLVLESGPVAAKRMEIEKHFERNQRAVEKMRHTLETSRLGFFWCDSICNSSHVCLSRSVWVSLLSVIPRLGTFCRGKPVVS